MARLTERLLGRRPLTPEQTARVIEVATAVKTASLDNPRRQASARLRSRAGKLPGASVRYTWDIPKEETEPEAELIDGD